MSALDFMKKLPQAFNPEGAGDANCVLLFKGSEPAYVTVKDGACSVAEAHDGDADVTLIMEDEDMVSLLKGELNGMEAFMTGKLQVEGDLMIAQQLPTFFDADKLAAL